MPGAAESERDLRVLPHPTPPHPALTMDEGAAPPLPIGKPSYEGSLYKRSEWLQQWRQRYFKLYLGPSGPRLYFCKDAESPPHGAIDLRQCLTVKSADDKTGKKNSFEVSTSEQHFFMYANTAQEKDDVRVCAAVCICTCF